jgi:hypothetical protein
VGDGLDLNSWWDDPDYTVASETFTLRGWFILRRLAHHDAAKLKDVMRDLYRDERKNPHDITKFEWKVILEYMGASPEEIVDVQQRMGRVWR